MQFSHLKHQQRVSMKYLTTDGFQNSNPPFTSLSLFQLYNIEARVEKVNKHKPLNRRAQYIHSTLRQMLSLINFWIWSL